MMTSVLSTTAALFGDEAAPQTPGNAPFMDITRKADQTTVEGPAEWFSGRVTITSLFQREAPSRVSGAIVHFEPGARTAWHVHPLGQTLIVTEGVGINEILFRPTAQEP